LIVEEFEGWILEKPSYFTNKTRNKNLTGGLPDTMVEERLLIQGRETGPFIARKGFFRDFMILTVKTIRADKVLQIKSAK
jgi:hypothetical protein